MIDLPRERSGSSQLDIEWNKMVRALRALRPMPGAGTATDQTVNGTARRAGAGGGGSATERIQVSICDPDTGAVSTYEIAGRVVTP